MQGLNLTTRSVRRRVPFCFAGRIVRSSPSLYDTTAGSSDSHQRIAVHEGDLEVFHLLNGVRLINCLLGCRIELWSLFEVWLEVLHIYCKSIHVHNEANDSR